MIKALPSQSLLRERLLYLPEDGSLLWKVAPAQSSVANGDLFGSITHLTGSNGTRKYRMGRFQGVDYYAHRLIWMYVTGDDPAEFLVDHINRDGLDNRFVNLRLVTRSENLQNQAGHARRESKYKGVYKTKSRGKWNGRWWGQVRRNNVLHTTKGSFATQEEAYEALQELLTTHGGLSGPVCRDEPD